MIPASLTRRRLRLLSLRTRREQRDRSRRLGVRVLFRFMPLPVLVVALSGCIPGGAPANAERAECEAGVAEAVAVLGPRVTAAAYCSAQVGRAFYDVPTNTVWLAYREAGDPNVGARWYASVAVHELGHAWDRWNGVPSASARYAEIRGNAGLPWCDAGTLSRCEDYADAFVRLIYDAGWYGYGFPPVTPEQAAALCRERLVPC